MHLTYSFPQTQRSSLTAAVHSIFRHQKYHHLLHLSGIKFAGRIHLKVEFVEFRSSLSGYVSLVHVHSLNNVLGSAG